MLADYLQRFKCKSKSDAYLCVFIHSLLHVLQQVVVGSTLSLIDVDDAVQIWEVAI